MIVRGICCGTYSMTLQTFEAFGILQTEFAHEHADERSQLLKQIDRKSNGAETEVITGFVRLLRRDFQIFPRTFFHKEFKRIFHISKIFQIKATQTWVR